MSLIEIEQLTAEQEALIPFYREKWKAIALSTEPIDRQKATEAVKLTYAAIGKKKPQILFKECGWIYAFEKTCIVCAHPIKVSFDNENRLHAEGEPAIHFADNYNLYYYHSLNLPEKYGKVHPHQWQVQWLLEENNTELRRALIQGIGYARLCQELQATEIDSWQEYSLLKITAYVDNEEIYLLKMTCPSTGFIHALRVPSNLGSARAAISWVNWGIDPEEFAAQT